jgi:hypothetical protein
MVGRTSESLLTVTPQTQIQHWPQLNFIYKCKKRAIEGGKQKWGTGTFPLNARFNHPTKTTVPVSLVQIVEAENPQRHLPSITQSRTERTVRITHTVTVVKRKRNDGLQWKWREGTRRKNEIQSLSGTARSTEPFE